MEEAKVEASFSIQVECTATAGGSLNLSEGVLLLVPRNNL